jgi:glycosyltransferase involved in cell wall biosynthesis
MFGEGFEFLEAAKREGVRIAVDIFITPVAHRVVREEQERFPDWEQPNALDAAVLERRVDEILNLADILTCPGDNVVEGLRKYASFDGRKARVIPYACGFDYGALENVAVEGRALFAGTAELRKGIHYLAKAANLLVDDGRRYEFRIAGGASLRVRQHKESRNLTFLGHLPVAALTSEIMSADVLVLPSLAEGSATVVYEALAAGVPVITTPSAGSIVTHNEDGLIVPERDPDALASALDAVLGDRDRRQRMAAAARRNRARYTETEWQQRLVSGLGLAPVRHDAASGCASSYSDEPNEPAPRSPRSSLSI